jgi:radical SAM family uncharacterized protein
MDKPTLDELKNLDRILHQVNKPARYTGGEWNSIKKDWEATPVRIALAYPDVYEIGMSNMAIPILYDICNQQPDVLAERVFTPWVDMAAAMRDAKLPLFSLESRIPLREFDVLGFSLGHELTYTNILNMLDLAGIPLLAAERDATYPLIIAGGSGALNPEPMADFIDFFALGDGEEIMVEILAELREQVKLRNSGRPAGTKKDILRRYAGIAGIYVPSLYLVEYNTDGRLKRITPTVPEAKERISRRIVNRLPAPVTKPVVPFIEVVHDRGAVEIQRGCSNGCRFCQAGAIYRPVRERPVEEVLHAVEEIISNCGYDEISLVSLSSSDYSDIRTLVTSLTQRYPDLAISLPSLYIGSFSVDLMECLPSHRKTGLTFAPEAGSERMRRTINKRVTENDLLTTATAAFSKGWGGLKLYFMLGLPGETNEDVQEIGNLVNKVYTEGQKVSRRPIQIRVNLSTFVPKPHTPFQWVKRESEEALTAKHQLLHQIVRRKAIRLSWSDPKVSQLEAVMSRGDRRLGKVIYQAWKQGSIFDSWGEHFNYANWLKAFADCGIDPDFYASRERSLDEILPWGHIDIGVSPVFLKEEYQRALRAEETNDCRKGPCNTCGLQSIIPACKDKLVQK